MEDAENITHNDLSAPPLVPTNCIITSNEVYFGSHYGGKKFIFDIQPEMLVIKKIPWMNSEAYDTLNEPFCIFIVRENITGAFYSTKNDQAIMVIKLEPCVRYALRNMFPEEEKENFVLGICHESVETIPVSIVVFLKDIIDEELEKSLYYKFPVPLKWIPYDEVRKSFLDALKVTSKIANENLIKTEDEEIGEQDDDAEDLEMSMLHPVFSNDENCMSSAELNRVHGNTQNFILSYPPNSEGSSIQLIEQDLQILNNGQPINDKIMDFYIKLLMDKYKNRELNSTLIPLPKIHTFKTSFYLQIKKAFEFTGNPRDEATQIKQTHLDGVRNWDKEINIFKQDFLVIPIQKDEHWLVAIVCFPNEITTVDIKPSKSFIVYLDSMKASDEKYSNVESHYIRQYLQFKWYNSTGFFKQFSRNVLGDRRPQVPKQDKCSDSGLFTLHYIEKFLVSPIAYMKKTSTSGALKEWFPELEVLEKRSIIKRMIMQLMDEIGDV